jgi:hypothetical protein
MPRVNSIGSLVAIGLICMLSAHAADKKANRISYPELINRLLDLEALAVLPAAGEKSAMWSSYDRQSIYNAQTGQYDHWDANSDGLNQYIRKEGDNIVMAEMQGPGAIVRIWSAAAGQGHVKIYIDDQPVPVIDLPFSNYFNGQTPPFNYSQLVYTAARGQNNYIPIAYQKSCKVVAGPEWGNYFHFNYITFPEGTQIEPFTMNLSAESLAMLEKVNNYFTDNRGTSPYPDLETDHLLKGTIAIPAGAEKILADIKGPFAIKSFKIKLTFANRIAEENALRKMVLQIFWDGGEQPAVWTPLGDFFGSTPGKNPYKTLPLGMSEDEMYAFWYMPFATSAKIKISNTDETDHQVAYEIVCATLTKPIASLGRFHAKWHGDVFPVSDPNRWPDWRVLKTEGKGRFVGMMLHILSPGREPCVEFAGAGQAWWGEGDEKFFVDGEKFPSTYGTGTEDYFGYAWGTPEYFEKAFHSQSMTMNNQGHQTVSRMQITDNVPFQHAFDGFIEKYYPNRCGTKYDCVAYWYLSEDGRDHHDPVPVAIDLWAPAPEISPQKGKFLAGESLSVEIKSLYDNIRYTLDGSEPVKTSLKYSGPLAIKQTTTLKAKLFLTGERESNTVTGYYTLDHPHPALTIDGKLIPGIQYNYYEGEWLELPEFNRLTALKSGISERFDLPAEKREEDFALLYHGYINIPKDGMYTFYLNSDDGSRLYIDGELVVDNDLQHAEQEVGDMIALEAGYHKIRVAYFEAKLANILNVRYHGPGISKQEIPAAVLYHLVE